MIFEQLNAGDCKTYLIASETTREAVLVDPLIGGVDHYQQLLAEKHLQLKYVLDTHVHADHISGAALLRDRTGAGYVMHKNSVAKCANIRVADGEELTIGDVTLHMLHTPGHTKDSLTVRVGNRILTGDFLFIGEGGAGRTDLPGGDAGDHHDALQKLAGLPDSTEVFPGHDYHGRAHSTLGEERHNNDRLRTRRSRNEYIQWLAGFKLGAADWMAKVVQANYLCTRDPNAVEIPCERNTCEVKAPPMAAPVGVSVAPVRTITCELLAELLTSQKPDLLLDVRNPDEYTGELGHIAGTRLIPLPEIAARAHEINDYKNKSVVTICKMGGRSAQAASALVSLGFRNVSTMAGGMARWSGLGLPVEK